MHKEVILEYLKKHGQRSDKQISNDAGISMPEVIKAIAELEASKKIYVCQATMFEDGVRVDYSLCRLSGFVPPGSDPNRFYTNRGVSEKQW